MLQDLAEIPHETTIEADVCIIGAGAAGITLARSLLNSPLQVCLLESGGFDHESSVTGLGVGSNKGMTYCDLVDTRLRFFGGTTNIWGGRCAPLDTEDFEAKSWVPHSGWPICFKDLRSGYQRAHQDLELGPPIDTAEAWQHMQSSHPGYLREAFTNSFWQFDEQKERFSASRCKDLFSAPNIRVITHASVTHLQANATASGLARVSVKGLGGQKAIVVARSYVLAAGAIENARLMLMSSDVETNGIGNSHDQVGRYFMEHPHGRLGEVVSKSAFDLWSTFEKRFPAGSVPLAAVVRASVGTQEREGILNTALTFKMQRAPEIGLALHKRAYQAIKHQLPPTSSNRALWHLYNKSKRIFQRYRTPLVKIASKTGKRNVYAMIRGEQAPNPESRITLSDSTDGLGKPKADLHWQLGDQDKHTLRVLARQLKQSLEQAGVGTFISEPWIDDPDPAWPVDPTVGNHPIGGYHHMGTTRMSRSASTGVTDENCQVFGYSNLFVAGSSVFTTSGWANPTLTIIALSHRLSDHLKNKLLTH